VKLVIGADHAGFPLKEEVRDYLAKAGHEVVDLGAYTGDQPDDYPDFAEKVGAAIKEGIAPRGIRAGMCHDTYSSHQGVEHDDMNVIVFGARIIGSALAYECVNAFIGAKFISNEPRFTRRYEKVLAIEAKYQCGDGSGSKA
jgi:ribose 5-phosphate isomerase B